jgi:hypothetical protein
MCCKCGRDSRKNFTGCRRPGGQPGKMGSFFLAVCGIKMKISCVYRHIEKSKMGSFGNFLYLFGRRGCNEARTDRNLGTRHGQSFVLRRAHGTEYEAVRQPCPVLVQVASRYTCLHPDGFITFHLRGKTYGNVLGATHCSGNMIFLANRRETGLKFDVSCGRFGQRMGNKRNECARPNYWLA